MEKKNTILLTVIAVATLLVAVVGATFAYFTATTQGNGKGTQSTNTTTSVGSVKLNYSDSTSGGDLKYPGGIIVQSGTVTSAVEGAGSFTGTYKVKATVDASALTSDNTVVTAKLYKLDRAVSGDLVTGCTMTPSVSNGTTTYAYSGCAVNSSITGTPVAQASTEDGEDVMVLTSSTIDFTNISSSSNHTAYYYLVVEYENNEGAAQNEDMGKSVLVTIDGVVEAQSAAAQA